MDVPVKNIILRIISSVLLLIVSSYYLLVHYPMAPVGWAPLASTLFSSEVLYLSEALMAAQNCLCESTGGYLMSLEIICYFFAVLAVLQIIFNRIPLLILWAGGFSVYVGLHLDAVFDSHSGEFHFILAMIIVCILCFIHFRFKDQLYRDRNIKAAIVYAVLILLTIYGHTKNYAHFRGHDLVATAPIALALLGYLLVWVISERKIHRMLECIAVVNCIFFLAIVILDHLYPFCL